jgi:pantoate--beta-alanine ligase
MTGSVGVVMTMGALHEGHAALLRHARSEVAHLVATIFVNPLQFGPAEDFARYPRTPDSDIEVCAETGVDVVFAPDAAQMYPAGEPSVTVSAGTVATVLEGAVRPGHFDGVLTVVLKLLNLIRPEVAYFGEKDYQQLTLIRAMATDLDLAVRIVGVPTVREPDGLARSSRNRYLSPIQRETARVLPRALQAGAAAASTGAAGVIAAARAELAGAPGVVPDYLELTGPDLGPVPGRGPARLLVAARIGQTRLIDNMEILLP